MEPMTMALVGAGMSAAGTAAGGSAGGGDKAGGSSYDPNQIALQIMQGNMANSVAAQQQGEADINATYTDPQLYYSTNLLPAQYEIEKNRLRNLDQTQTAGVNFGLNEFLPQARAYMDMATEYGLPNLQKGLALAGKAYDAMGNLIDLEAPVNQQTQGNVLYGLQQLKQLGMDAEKYDPMEQASMAFADVQQQYNNSSKDLMQQMAAMGISPDSPAAIQALTSLGVERAGGLGTAWTQGRRAGEEIKFNRQSTLAGANSGLQFRNSAATAAQLAPNPGTVVGQAQQLGQGIYNFGLGAGASAAFPYFKPNTPANYDSVAKNMYYASQPYEAAGKYSQTTTTGSSGGNSAIGGLGTGLAGIGGRVLGSGLGKMM